MRRKARRRRPQPARSGKGRWLASLAAGWALTGVWYASGAADGLVRLLRWWLFGG